MSKVSEMLKSFAMEGVKVCAALFVLYFFFGQFKFELFFSILALMGNVTLRRSQKYYDTLKKVKFKFIVSS